jgi:YgiT-type zinc finger domain-containing protein
MMICQFCGGPATAVKTETDIDYSDETEAVIDVEVLVCDGCAEHWYDGTEDHPGTRPLITPTA